jgi:ATP-binding cassette subfamily B protein
MSQPEPRRGSSAGRVLPFVWRRWRERVPRRFALVLAGVAAGVLLEAQIPRLSAELTTAVEAQLRGTDTGAGAAAVALVSLFAAVFAVKQAYLRVWMHLAAEVMQGLVTDGFARVQRFATAWHADHFAGSTVRRITRGMHAYDTLADTLVIELGPALALLLALAVAMGLRDPLLGACFAVAMIVFLAVSIALSLAWVAPANARRNDADTALGGALADAVTCNATVKAFGAEAREDARMRGVAERWRRLARASWTRSMDAGAVQSVLLVLLLGGLLAVALGFAEGPRLPVDDVVYVIATYLVVNGYLRNVGWQVRNAQGAIDELDDLVALTATEPQVVDPPDARTLEPGPGEVRFEAVRFRYPGQAAPVFDGLDVRIAAGEKVALVGPSGSGKSTFAKLLQRLHDVDGGRILLDGRPLTSVTQASLRRAIAVVPQDPLLFHRTLRENIAYGRPDADDAAIEAAARRAHAHGFVERLPAGYETLVGERGVKLSGGERQRVAIARAILADTPLLVLDEATSSLDAATERLIQAALEELMRDRTAIVIAHRLSTIRSVDRVLVFERGRIVEEGDHEALMARPDGRYRRLVELQTGGAA